MANLPLALAAQLLCAPAPPAAPPPNPAAMATPALRRLTVPDTHSAAVPVAAVPDTEAGVPDTKSAKSETVVPETVVPDTKAAVPDTAAVAKSPSSRAPDLPEDTAAQEAPTAPSEVPGSGEAPAAAPGTVSGTGAAAAEGPSAPPPPPAPTPLVPPPMGVPAQLPAVAPLPTPAAATAVLGAPNDSHWYNDISVDALLVPGYAYRSRGLAPLSLPLNTFALDMAQLWLQAEAQRPFEGGFVLEVVRSDAAAAQVGTRRLGIRQAHVSAMLPAGLEMSLGHLPSDIGSEGLTGYARIYEGGAPFEQANLQASRSLLFASTPALLTGARLRLQPLPQLGLAAYVANGWQGGGLDTNAAKSFAFCAQLVPGGSTLVQLHYLGGVEAITGDTPARHLIDVVLSLHGAWGGIKVEGLALAQQRRGAPSQWWGGALANLRVNLGERLGLALRGEFFDAQNQTPPPVPTTDNALSSDTLVLAGRMLALSLTPTLALTDNVSLRLEGRYDARLARAGSSAYAGSTTVLAQLLFVL